MGHTWEIEVRRITHRDCPDKRYRQAGWTVIARRSDEVVTATWIDEAVTGRSLATKRHASRSFGIEQW